MKTIFTLLIALFSSVHLLTAQTEVGGGIFTNTIWTLSESPYEVISDIVIFPDQTLTIEPGVEIYFRPNTKLENRDGNLIAEGTRDALIIFSITDSTQKWKGIINNNLEQDSLIFNFEYVSIEYAETGIDFGAEYAYQTIVGSFFKNNDRAVYDGGQGYHWIQLYGCNFKDNEIGMEGRMSVWDSYFEGNNIAFANPLHFYNIEEGGRVINCIFESNEMAVAANEQYITYAAISQSTFNNNGKAVYLYWANIDSSTFNASYGTAIQLQKGSVRHSMISNNATGIEVDIYNYQLEITNNDISMNDYGIVVSGQGALIEGNSFCSNQLYSAFISTDAGINLTNNCWCTSEETEIQEDIYDAYDDVTLGIASFAPFDTTCVAPVFPGDGNRNGIVDASDLLFVGLKLGTEGPHRSAPGMYWSGHKVEDWSDNFAHGLNTKFTDTNGDGVIDEEDIKAIEMNYNSNHDHILEQDIPISDHPATDLTLTTNIFDENTLEINLENQGNFENLKGLSFTLVFDSPVIETQNVAWWTEGSWWISNIENTLSISYPQTNISKMDFALVKKNDEELVGEGKIMTINIQLPQAIDLINIELENIIALNNEGLQIETFGNSYSETITAISSINEEKEIIVSPNPVASSIKLVGEDEFLELRIQSISGKTVLKTGYTTNLSVAELEAGFYVLSLIKENSVRSTKFIKQ